MSKALELLSVAIFFLLYKYFDIFTATIGLVITTIGLAILEYIKTGKLSKLTIVNLSVLLIMSSITLILEDASFIKMKPAIIYLCLGSFLLADLMILKKFFIGKIYQAIFQPKGIILHKKILQKFTVHWIIILFVVAVVNEVMWRVFGEGAWVNFKVFFIPIILVLMIMSHIIYVNRYEKNT